MRLIRGPFILLNLLLLILVKVSSAEDNCLTCHQDFEEEDGPSFLISRDIHIQRGLGCADCHGGDPTLDDMDEVRENKSYRGVPDYLKVPEFCARCHSDPTYMREYNPSLPTDQLERYKTSIHGQQLFGGKNQKVANCISCHSVHQIADARQPHSSIHPLNVPNTCGGCHSDTDYMAEYDIPTTQNEEYVKSVHGVALLQRQDLGAPACNDCHGSHGAAPRGVTSLDDVCGNCHAIEAAMFNDSPHRQAYEDNDFPMCATCHDNHLIVRPSDSLIGSQEPALCADCHSVDDDNSGAVTADGMLALINQLKSARDSAQALLEEAHAKGMMTVDEEFMFGEVEQAMIQTRTRVHTFNLDSLREQAAAGIAKADTVSMSAGELIHEYHFRRQGLALSTLFISILALGLFLRIRKMS